MNYSKAASGTRTFRSRQRMNYSLDMDVTFGKVYPVYYEFVLPNDVFKISARVFARYQPTLAPILNRCNIRMRYMYVPIRQIEDKAETVITGSSQGHSVADVPVLKNFVDSVTNDDYYVVNKGEFYDCLGVPCLDYKNIKDDRCLPAKYWYKAYRKIYYDMYRDENLQYTEHESFEEHWNYYYNDIGAHARLFHVNLKKDYFTAATPFELKGEIPTFDVTVDTPFQEDSWLYEHPHFGDNPDAGMAYFNRVNMKTTYHGENQEKEWSLGSKTIAGVETGETDYEATQNVFTQNLHNNQHWESESDVLTERTANLGIPTNSLNAKWNGLSGSFNMRDIRRMSAITRIKERDMRCGSRYTEYLRSNFQTSPADETLQRPVYLGGFIQPIVTNEVLQTGQGSDPVGTLRGKGISDGGNTIPVFRSKEFGIIFGLLDIVPETLYTQGIDRRLTYISRYDFFNPSFQNLSEQEVRNGEIFVSNSDGKNDETFGFQGMYNELRSRKNIVTGDLRDRLKYWTQAIEFASRPHLNGSFLNTGYYEDNYKRPFAVENANPIILHVDNYNDAYRPMVKEPVPGLVDHN